MKKLILAVFLVFAVIAYAVPSQNTGSVFAYFTFPAPTADFSNYILYYGSTSSNYTFWVSTGSSTNWTLSGLQRGNTYYFNVTQITTNGVESDYTTEASITIPQKPPKANSLNAQL